jgi:hypothetical protein
MMDISNCEALPRTITFPCKNLQKMGHPPGAAGNVQPKIGVGSPQSIAHGPPHFADAVSCDNFDVQPRSSMLHEHKRILHASARLRSCYGFTRQVSVVRNTSWDSDWPDGGRPSSGNPHFSLISRDSMSRKPDVEFGWVSEWTFPRAVTAVLECWSRHMASLSLPVLSPHGGFEPHRPSCPGFGLRRMLALCASTKYVARIRHILRMASLADRSPSTPSFSPRCLMSRFSCFVQRPT